MPLPRPQTPQTGKTARKRHSTNNGITKKHTPQSAGPILGALKQRVEAGLKAKHTIAERTEERKRIEVKMDKALFGVGSSEQTYVPSIPSSKERLLALIEPPAFDISEIFAAVDASLARKRNPSPPPPPRPNPQNQSRFFAIPLETRTQIYRLVLTTPKVIIDPPQLMEIWRDDSYAPRPACGVSGSLLRTCSRIYQEAVRIPYQENTFAFTSAYAIQCFRGLDYIVPGCPLRTQMMRKLHLWFGNTNMSFTGMTTEKAETQARDWRMHFFEGAEHMVGELKELTLDFSRWPEVPWWFLEVLERGRLKAEKVSVLGLEGRDYVPREVEQTVGKVG